MKLMTGLALLTISMNTAFAAKPKLSPFKKAMNEMRAGTFKGKTDYKKDCTMTLIFQKDAEGNDEVVGTIDFISYSNQPATSTVVINSKKDEVSFEKEEEAEEYKELAITKSKSIPEPDNEGAYLTIIETIKQDFEGDELTGMRLEWYEINEHSDPHEDQLSCSIYNK